MKWWNSKVIRVMIGLTMIFAFALGSFPALARVKVTFYSWMAAEVTSGGISVLEDAESKFEALHPEVDIETVPLPWEVTPDQLTLMTAAGNPPDIATVETLWMGQLVAMGGIQPLDDFIPAEFKDAMVPAAYKDGLIKGKLHALTWNPNPNILVYNKDLMKRAGLAQLPKNMEEFTEQIEKIARLGPDIYGSELWSSLDVCVADYFHSWFWNFGGDMMDEEGNVVIHEKGAVDAVTWFKSLTDRGYNPKGDWSREARVLYAQGKVGFMVEGPWIKGILEGLGFEYGKWDITVYPGSAFTGEMGYSIPSHHMLMMSKQCKHKDLAWKYMEFIVSDPEITKTYYQSTGLLPVLTSAYEDPIYAGKYARTLFKQMQAMKMPNIYAYPLKAELERFFLVALQDVIYKGVDPQEAMEQTAKNMRILLGR